MRNNYYDISAPTGCTASLVNGKSRFTNLIIPVGKKRLNNTTTNIVIKNAGDRKYWHDYYKHIYFL